MRRKGDTPSKLASRIASKEWSLAVRARAGNKCELCEKPSSAYQMAAHHICRKASNYMKTLLDNGICLCNQGCHFNGVHSPDWETQREFSDKILEHVGEERMNRLLQLKHNPPKMTYEELEERREELKLKIKEYETPCRHEFKKGTFFIGKDLYKMLDCVKCGVTFKKKI